VALYRDGFMAGFNLRDSPAFGDWQFFEAESLQRELAGVLERLTQCHGARGEWEAAITCARRWLALDPLHEPAHRALMSLYMQSGQRSAALRQYQECERILETELGITPAEETTRLFQEIKENRFLPPASVTIEEIPIGAVNTAELGDTAAALASIQNRNAEIQNPTNLPTLLTRLIGRENELAHLTKLLKGETASTRLITLLGPPGIGKTRLALQATIDLKDHFADGAYFVNLASASHPDLALAAIAQTLGIQEASGQAMLERLKEILRTKHLLLMLDNFEQVIAAAPLVTELLSACPHVKMLVTSREALRVRGEQQYPVQPLGMPNLAQLPAVDALAHYPAVALFVERAQAVDPGFAITPENALAVSQICARLEGIPLGIELAATWVRALSCEDIAQEIERNLDFLVVAARDMPDRHRSLRAAFDHSWNLLMEDERRALRKLSVFRGGFRREAADRIAGAGLPMLSVLADKSLLRRTPIGRYDLHELVRQYAAEHLHSDAQEEESTHDRHSSYYMIMLQEREGKLKGPSQAVAVGEILEEIDNIRAAWEWTATRGKSLLLRQAIRSLSWFHDLRSWHEDAELLFERSAQALRPFAEGADDSRDSSRDAQIAMAQCLAHQGWFCFRWRRYGLARDLLRHSSALLAPLDDQRALGDTLTFLGHVSHMMGNYAEGRQLLEEALALHQATGSRWAAALTLNSLGMLSLIQGEYHEADCVFRKALAIWHEVGAPRGTAFCLSFLSLATHLLGNHDEAQELSRESLAIGRAVGDHWTIAIALNHLGLVAFTHGEAMFAQALFQQSRTLFSETGDRWSVAQTSKHLGLVAFTLGDYAQAQQNYAQALRISMEVDTIPVALDALLGMATVLAADGEPEQALEIVAQVLTHPATGKPVHQRAMRLRDEVTQSHPRIIPPPPINFEDWVRALLSAPYQSEPIRANTSLEG
jgi:predicted ATPase